MLVKDAFVSETPEVEFEALRLDDLLIWSVANNNLCEIRLACSWAKTGEFVSLEDYDVVPPGVVVRKGLELFRRSGTAFSQESKILQTGGFCFFIGHSQFDCTVGRAARPIEITDREATLNTSPGLYRTGLNR